MRAKSRMLVALTLVVAGCSSFDSAYEEGVSDYEPVYCYRSIGGVSCFDTPHHRDERRMVNYYGPSPVKDDRAEQPPEPRLDPPPVANYYVRDPEPIPRPAPHGALDDRPWLPPAYRQGAPRSADPGGHVDRPWLTPSYRPQSGAVEDETTGESPID